MATFAGHHGSAAYPQASLPRVSARPPVTYGAGWVPAAPASAPIPAQVSAPVPVSYTPAPPSAPLHQAQTQPTLPLSAYPTAQTVRTPVQKPDLQPVPPSVRPVSPASVPSASVSSPVSSPVSPVLPASALRSSNKFASLGEPKRIWVIGSVHGDVEKLQLLHDEIATLFKPGDRLLYLGNFIGVGEKIIETVNELLDFRRALIAMPGIFASDVVYLRGGQEEMWSKLLQIQFSPNASETIRQMLQQGAEKTLLAYRGQVQQGLSAAREGVMAMTRWTSLLRSEIRAHPGHEALYTALRRAAFTGDEQGKRVGSLLFVNAGLDTGKPLANQGDSFCWGAANWGMMTRPYGHFTKIIRGYDPAHLGAAMTTHTLTIDGGCGFGGSLLGACLTPQGEVIDIIEV